MQRRSRLLSLPIMSIICCVALLSLAATPVAAQIFINEIHYDNAGADSGEAIEIAGPAGTDLAGWSLVLYNGSNGAVYNTIALSGTIPNQQTGFGTLGFTQAGIQNGSPDGLALVDAGSVVVEFLSYEGSFVAVGGPANGMVSTDIGVSESSSTPVGDSLQLTGTGTMSGDFAWTPSQPNTFGAVNTGQTFTGGGGPADPLINEFVVNHTGSDTEAFVEVFGNPSADYSAFTVLEIEGDGSGAGVIDAVLPVGTTDAGGYWIDPEDMENGTLTILLVENFSGSVGSDLDTDNDGTFDSTPWTRIVDEVAVGDGGGSDFTYSTTALAPGFDGNPFTPGGASRIPNSTDTDSIGDWLRNDFDGFGFPGFPGSPVAGEAENTPGAVNVPVPPEIGEIVINEIDYDQPGLDTAEFIEIYNADSVDVSLNGFSLNLVNGNGVVTYKTIALPAITLAPGDFFVVCGDASQVTRCGLDVSPNSNLIQNGAPDAVALTFEGTIVDTVSYEGDTGAPFTEGSGAGLADDSFGGTGGPNENKSISRLPDGFDTDQNNIDFIFVCATPGSANTTDTMNCPSVAPPNLLINEVDYDQPGGDTAEFIEIVNNGLGDVGLGGITLELVNGSGGGAVVYQTIALPAATLAGGDYFVVCADTLTVANCDLEIINSIQNGAPDAVALLSAGAVLDTVSYEGDTAAPYTEGSGVGLQDSGSSGQDFRGIGRFPDGADSNQNNVDFANACITPGGPNTSLTTGCTSTAPVLEIYEIQGAGVASPFDGQSIRTENNVVTAVGIDQFAMQTPEDRSDVNVDTSDGIVVFTGGAPGVAVGDVVTVTGTVIEFFDFTEFTGGSLVEIVSPGGAVPAPVAFGATVPSPDPTAQSCAIEFECYEGMLVEIADGTVTGPNQRFGTDPVAEVHITAAPARTFREPGVEFPGLSTPPIPTWDGNPEVFELDPDKLGLPNQIIPAGSSFSATGVVGFEFGGYELWPSALSVDPVPLPVSVRPREPGEFTVGTLNLFRLFDDIDDPADADGRDDTVVSTAEYQLRLSKFSEYILAVLGAPDILAVQEVESLTVLGDLAARIEADDPSVIYTALLVEGNDIGTIDVGFLVRDNITVDAVTQVDPDVTFFNPITMEDNILHDRPPLLLEARCELQFGSFPIAVMAVHNRSLSGIDGSEGLRVRVKRLLQAESIASKVRDLQTADPDVRLVVTGDFNAFEFTDGYVDSLGVIKGDLDPSTSLVCSEVACPGDLVEPNLDNVVLTVPADDRYSFIFRGSAQVLDHVLTSAKLVGEVTGIAYGRGNADAAFDLINDVGPLRSSDHDGLVLYIDKESTLACVDDLGARAKSTKVQLVWGDTGAPGGYNVYRSLVGGGPYTLIANTTSTYSTYLDQGLVNDTTYYYVVREVAANGDEICQSNEASGTPAARRRR